MLLTMQLQGSWSKLHWRWEHEKKAMNAREYDTKLHAITLKSGSPGNKHWMQGSSVA